LGLKNVFQPWLLLCHNTPVLTANGFSSFPVKTLQPIHNTSPTAVKFTNMPKFTRHRK